MKTFRLFSFLALAFVCFQTMSAQLVEDQSRVDSESEGCKAQPAIPRDEKVETQVESLLSKMSLDDKVGQMCELAIDKVQRYGNAKTADGKPVTTLAGGMLSAPSVDETFSKWRVGSILNVPEGVAQTPQVWSDIIRTLNSESQRLCGVPELYGVDQIHGASYSWGATMFPQEIGQAASFNTAIPYRIGQITAYESRACLIPWIYAPVMDLARSPLWPRVWESYGEDVLVNAMMGSSVTRALQGADPNHVGMNNVAVCLKHYMAYGAAVSGKDRTPSSVTYRELMEKYFQPFRTCIEAGALSIMVNSGVNNGVPFHMNHTLLTEWLKEGLQWDGMIVTDWADIDNIWKRDHVAANKKEAICLAINAGIDMSMDPYSTNFCTLLKELVEEGKVPMSRIDDAVRRILRLKIRVGLLDSSTWDIPYSSKKKKAVTLETLYSEYGSMAFANEASKMAEECMVLLKNKNGLLPLHKGQKILCCGPNANNFRPMNGGWSYTWQGNRTDEICRKIGKYKTFYDAIAEQFGAENVKLKEMVTYDSRNFNSDHFASAISDDINAFSPDVIIAFIGENSYCETVGNIDDLNISANQSAMVQQLAKMGKPIILVLNEGRPRLISNIEPLATSVVHTFLPGNYGGEALARLLIGESNFSGRMPYTYPRHHGSFITYDCKPCEYVETMDGAYNYEANTTVQWPFGYGLSYSDVRYANLKVTHMPQSVGTTAGKKGFKPLSTNGVQFARTDSIQFTVDVTNNSDRAVKEPVLLYVSDLVASLTPDVKRLRAFTKVALAPHQTKTVTLSVHPSDLAFVNESLQWVLEPGKFRAAVANQKAEFEIK